MTPCSATKAPSMARFTRNASKVRYLSKLSAKNPAIAAARMIRGKNRTKGDFGCNSEDISSSSTDILNSRHRAHQHAYEVKMTCGGRPHKPTSDHNSGKNAPKSASCGIFRLCSVDQQQRTTETVQKVLKSSSEDPTDSAGMTIKVDLCRPATAHRPSGAILSSNSA